MSSPFRMNVPVTTKTVVLTIFCAMGSLLYAQVADPTVPVAGQAHAQKLNPEELNRLLAPIALYPDALIALILPASTVPSDVVLGARFLQANGDPNFVENQAWDESVKSLTRYPEVLAWMDQNLEWTSSVGEAFVEQPADVMNAIQALRRQAKVAGNLQDTPEQKVIVEEEGIRIVPADPQVIFVPQYDPEVVYVQSYSQVPVLTFGVGFAVGPWLVYDFDWNRRCLYHGPWHGWEHDWHNNWNHSPGGDRAGDNNRANVVNIDVNNANPWQPGENSRRQINQRQRNNNGNARYVNPVSTGQTTVPQNVLPHPTRLERLSPERESVRRQYPERTGSPVEQSPPASRVVPGVPPVDVRNGPSSNFSNPSRPNPDRGKIVPSIPSPVPGQTNIPSRVDPPVIRQGETPVPTPDNIPSQREKVRLPSTVAPRIPQAGEHLKKQTRPTGDGSQNSNSIENPVQTVRPPVQAVPQVERPRPQVSREFRQPQSQQTSDTRTVPSPQIPPAPVVNPQTLPAQTSTTPALPSPAGEMQRGGQRQIDGKRTR